MLIGALYPHPAEGCSRWPWLLQPVPIWICWPLPNGPAIAGGIAILNASANSSVGENFFVTRADHHFSDKQSMFARFTFDQGTATQPDAVPITATSASVHTRYVTIQHDYVVSPQFLMTSRIAYNRTLLSGDDAPLVSYPASLNLFYPGWIPQLGFAGITVLGPGGQNLVRRAQNVYDFQENMQYIRGGHSIRFGLQVTHVGSNKNNEIAGLNGQLTWNSLADFMTDARLSAFSAMAAGSDWSRTFARLMFPGRDASATQ